jgi:hypothetical protein
MVTCGVSGARVSKPSTVLFRFYNVSHINIMKMIVLLLNPGQYTHILFTDSVSRHYLSYVRLLIIHVCTRDNYFWQYIMDMFTLVMGA